MNVKELRAEREQLEMCLRQETDSLVSAFVAKTGFHPQSITVDIIDVTHIGSPQPQYRLGDVNVEIKI